eukprot:CAMPEP_0170753744 /NCGR_PEP_ID=MMETSP0437-20130122/12650_1 /TAXON_ID=0 /ORGANISM="Sexangularia sp." /LENGTH=157 /DNA_ID=CAMNT_0011092871 /DNA_START=298 /DNA_END=771 /DNA_ORIENTATION=+
MDDVLRKLEVKKFNLQVQGDGYADLGTRVFGGPPKPVLASSTMTGADWELVDSEDGPYYWNRRTDETSWDRPAELGGGGSSRGTRELSMGKPRPPLVRTESEYSDVLVGVTTQQRPPLESADSEYSDMVVGAPPTMNGLTEQDWGSSEYVDLVLPKQ